MSLFLCLVRQTGTSVFNGEVAFLCAGQGPKAEPKLVHEPICFLQIKELTGPSSLASRTLSMAALFLLGGSLNIPSYLTRLSFQSLQCSVIHSATFTMPTEGKHYFFYLEIGMAEKTEQGPSHIDLTGSQIPVMGILVTGGENPTLLD